jgi:hypothetical protein
MMLSEITFLPFKKTNIKSYPTFGLLYSGSSMLEMQPLTNHSLTFWRRQIKYFISQQSTSPIDTLSHMMGNSTLFSYNQ